MGLSSLINGQLAGLRRLGAAFTHQAPRHAEDQERWADTLSQHRRKLATLGLAMLAFLFAYHVVFGANGMLTYREKRAEYRELQLEIDRLEKENRGIAEQNKALQSDPKAIEREAREQLRYARPGDIVVVLPGKQPEEPPSDASAQTR